MILTSEKSSQCLSQCHSASQKCHQGLTQASAVRGHGIAVTTLIWNKHVPHSNYNILQGSCTCLPQILYPGSRNKRLNQMDFWCWSNWLGSVPPVFHWASVAPKWHPIWCMLRSDTKTLITLTQEDADQNEIMPVWSSEK